MKAEPLAAIGPGALAFIATASIAAGALFTRTYLVTTCFSRPGFSGCGTVRYPFSVEALPALLWPAALFGALTLVAGLAWRAPSTRVAAVATTGFAALASGAIAFIAPLLAVPLILLVLAFLRRAGRGVREALIDLGLAAALTALAIAAAYTLLFAATLWRGGWLGGLAPAMWLYLAFAGAVAIGGGCALALRGGREQFPLARSALWTYLSCGLAGLAALLLIGEPDLKAAAFRSVFVLAAVAIPLGALALRFALRFTRSQALAGSLVAALAFPLCFGIALGALTSISGVSSIGPELPRVPWLPGTSTLAFTCARRDPRELAREADVIVDGVIEAESILGMRVRVEQVYPAGRLYSGGSAERTITVLPGQGNANRVGSPWTFYLKRNPIAYEATDCGGSHPGILTLDEKNAIGKGETPRPDEQLFGPVGNAVLAGLAALLLAVIARRRNRRPPDER